VNYKDQDSLPPFSKNQFGNPLAMEERLLEQGVCHTVALPFTLKKYIKAKEEELWKLKYFTMQKYYNLSKKSSKRKPKSFKILLLL
jgi:hypothetical protein